MNKIMTMRFLMFLFIADSSLGPWSPRWTADDLR
jgi:hypothetical protein